MATAADIPLQITSENSSSERRISPAWTITHFKARLEPITGVPAGCQRLTLKLPGGAAHPVEAASEDATQLAQWPLQPYAEIHVGDTGLLVSSACFRPPISARRLHVPQGGAQDRGFHVTYA
jgi:tubulin-specific chaperone B